MKKILVFLVVFLGIMPVFASHARPVTSSVEFQCRTALFRDEFTLKLSGIATFNASERSLTTRITSIYYPGQDKTNLGNLNAVVPELKEGLWRIGIKNERGELLADTQLLANFDFSPDTGKLNQLNAGGLVHYANLYQGGKVSTTSIYCYLSKFL